MKSVAEITAKSQLLNSKKVKKNAVYRLNSNNNHYINRSDHPLIFKRLVPNTQWHPKYAKMLLSSDAHYVLWLAQWVMNNSRITDKCRYFAKCCGRKAWTKTIKFIKRLRKLKELFAAQPDWWLNWTAAKASDYLIDASLAGKSPPKLLSFLIKKTT